MQLIFERSRGRYKSNCNILALAWMPYYNEAKFRQALFDYHQKQLINLTNSNPIPASRDDNHVGQLASRSRDLARRADGDRMAVARDRSLQANDTATRENGNNSSSHGRRSNESDARPELAEFLNSRIAELHQRYLYAKNSRPNNLVNTCELTHKLSGAIIADELDQKYGRMSDFGWLAIGNVGRIVGVTLTSLVPPPEEKLRPGCEKAHEQDLIVFNEDDKANQDPTVGHLSNLLKRDSNAPERPDRSCLRSNYNLRGHMDEIILVRWNELYQKLATVDSKGNVLIWCKVNEKFTIQTPFYNRTKTVADLKWSNDGKTALICYTDSFILVGSSSGHRHWHSMLNLDDYHITCASWTPNDDQLLLGVSNGNVVVIDLPSSELTELIVNRTNIRTMCWSTCDIRLRSMSKLSYSKTNRSSNTNRLRPQSNDSTKNSNVVNHRRLSRDCSVFSRYRFCSQGPNETRLVSSMRAHDTTTSDPSNRQSNERRCNILAIDFADSTIKLYNGGLSDLEPKTIQTNQESYLMQWSSSGKILAVAGFNIHTSTPSIGYLRCRYSNAIKFYSQQGCLIYQHTLEHTQYPITAFTWGHEDKRIFVATGPMLHCAKVHMEVGPLSLMTMKSLQRYTRLPDKAEVIENILKGHYGQNIHHWQSHNCPIDIQREAQRSRQKSDKVSSLLTADAPDDSVKPTLCYNSNVYQYRLPLKLCGKVDELFAKTLRQPFDESWTLSDTVWHVPRDKRRYYCTLMCYTCEQEIGQGNQYRSRLIENRSSPDNHTSDQNKIFVLYFEVEGSLVPILKARRVGFLKPEFVIFDPEDSHPRLARQHKVSDISQQHFWPASDRQAKMRKRHQPLMSQDMIPQVAAAYANSSYYGDTGANYMDNCNELHSYSEPRASGSSNGRQSLSSEAENYYNFECDTDNRRHQLKFYELMNNRSHHQEPLALPLTSDQYLLYMMNIKSDFALQNPIRSTATKMRNNILESESLKVAINRYRTTEPQFAGDNLPESKELVRIKSNIWGTKFKLFNIGNRVIRPRSLLGSVVYKASILHLQPRQIFISIKDLSNYCCLCSKHHHTVSNSPVHKSLPARETKRANDVSLLDLPNAEQPLPRERARSKPRSSRRKEQKSNDSSKVLIPVGDSIRVVPKLERNQHYRFAGSLLDDQQPSTSKDSRVKPSHRSRGHSKINNSPKPAMPGASTSRATASEDHENDYEDDDVLTLSLGNSNQYEIGMSTSGATPTPECNPARKERENEINEFLASNKTLKSIQTITKMIVDLSSKANDDNEVARASEESSIISPSKLIKVEDELSSGAKALASLFIPPDTPVHRPRRKLSISKLKDRNSSDSVSGTQSASTTPLKGSINRDASQWRTRRRRDSSATSSTATNDWLGDSQLPPPPPSVPFGRRLSTSAKRFFDGSLRSLYSAGQSTSSDAEPEEHEPLVKGSSSRLVSKPRASLLSNYIVGQHSQPGSPLKSGKSRGRHQMAPNEQLFNLKQQLWQKIRRGGSGTQSDVEAPCENLRSPATNHSTGSRLRKFRSAWSSAEADGQQLSSKSMASRTSRPFESGSTSSSSDWSLGDSDLSESSSENGTGRSAGESPSRSVSSSLALQAFATPLRRTTRQQSRSKHKGDLLRSNDKELERATAILRTTSGNGKQRQEKRRRRRRARRKTICSNQNCCCAREIKLNNRPPVWNELSQVYQLDFGGRVTQESAKNLQVDFEGNLALQFGRVDRCTYTLDYGFPFNAVQAMAIALASLTQRLK